MEDTLHALCLNTYTVADMHRRIGLLKASLEKVLFSNASADDVAQEAVAYAQSIAEEKDKDAVVQWELEVWKRFDAQNLSTQLEVLTKSVALLPVLIVYIPVEFDVVATASLGTWCRENISAKLLLDLHVDPAVTGGCAVVSRDTYVDLSLHSKLREHTGAVTELLNTYA
jgi:hypothetical protein